MKKSSKNKVFPKIEGIIAGIGILIILELVTFFIYNRALVAQKGEIFEGLTRTTYVINTLIDTDKHPLLKSREQEYSDLYNNLIEPLKKALDSDDTIEFIYTMVQDTLDKETIRFILDPTEEGDSDGDGVDDKAHVMVVYDVDDPILLDALSRCFNEKEVTITKKPYEDEWGGHISCFAPIYNKKNEFIGVLGLDISAKTFNERLEPIKRATQRAMITVFFIAYLTGLVIWFLRNISKKENNILQQIMPEKKQDK